MKRFSPSSEIAHLVAAVRRIQDNPTELFDTYGIKILERGIIWDTLYEEQFANIPAWAAFTVAQEHLEDDEDDDQDYGYEDDE